MHTPQSLPPLAEQLIQGKAKISLNPHHEAIKKSRRAITLPMLKLLENAVASRTDWTMFEKSLRWATILTCFWGSFRIGEILHPKTYIFNKDHGLLASDVTFHEHSVSLWIRMPKI